MFYLILYHILYEKLRATAVQQLDKIRNKGSIRYQPEKVGSCVRLAANRICTLYRRHLAGPASRADRNVRTTSYNKSSGLFTASRSLFITCV